MPSIQSILLLSAAVATVSGNAFQKTIHNVADNTQTALETKSEHALIITARDEVRATHLAEIAEADVAIKSCGPARVRAQSAVEDDMQLLQEYLGSKGLESTVTSSATIRDDFDNDWDELPPRRYRKDGGKDTDEAADGDETYCADAALSVTVRDLDLLELLGRNLTSNLSEMRIEYVDWQLTDATKHVLKSELRRKAIANMAETGKDYAAAFGVEKLAYAGLEEEYGYTDVRRVHRSRGWYRSPGRSIDLEVPELEMMMEVKYKYSA